MNSLGRLVRRSARPSTRRPAWPRRSRPATSTSSHWRRSPARRSSAVRCSSWPSASSSGSCSGLIVAYTLEALNTSVRRPEDLEAVLRVPGLAVIPRITGGSRHGGSHLRKLLGSGKGKSEAGSPMSGDQTFSIGIEAFRNLRTSLIWSDGGETLKTLVVTSAAPGEGQDAHRRQPRGHPGLRRAAGAAGGLRHSPAARPRAVPRAPRPGTDGAPARPRAIRTRRRPAAIRQTSRGADCRCCRAAPCR